MELQATREAVGLTQSQVAQKSNMTTQQYQNYEYGKREPGVRTAIRIAKALNSTVEDLFSLPQRQLRETQNEPDDNQAKQTLK